MTLVRTDKMEENPGVCMNCGGGNIIDGESHDCLKMEGVDIDWGNTPYVCHECMDVIRGLFGWITEEEKEELVSKLDTITERLEEVQEEHLEYKERVSKVVGGKKATKELQEAISG